MNFEVFSNLNYFVCSGSTWSISSDVTVSHKSCVTSLLPHIVQELLLLVDCASHGTLLWITSVLITCWKGGCEGVVWLEMCPGISWVRFVWLMAVTLSGRRHEGGKLVELATQWMSSWSWKVRTIHGNCPPASFLFRSLYRKSALCTFSCAFSKRNPKEGSASGQCCSGGSLSRTPWQHRTGGWGVLRVTASRILLGYFLQTTSVMCLWRLRWQMWKESRFIVLVGHVQQISDLWQDCLDGFDSSVEVDALSVLVKVKQVPLATTNFLLSV